jgi:hypothetical protein
MTPGAISAAAATLRLESAAVQETAAQFGPPTTGGSINEVGWRFQSFRINNLEMVDQNSVSWNQINEWLRQLNRLLAAA